MGLAESCRGKQCFLRAWNELNFQTCMNHKLFQNDLSESYTSIIELKGVVHLQNLIFNRISFRFNYFNRVCRILSRLQYHTTHKVQTPTQDS